MAHIQRAGYEHAMPDEFEFADFDEDEDEFSEDMREDQFGSDFDDEFDSVSILSLASFVQIIYYNYISCYMQPPQECFFPILFLCLRNFNDGTSIMELFVCMLVFLTLESACIYTVTMTCTYQFYV